MNRFRGLLRQLEFHILVLIFGFVCLSWPLMSVFEQKHPGIMLIYLSLIWTILVAFLFLISRSIRNMGDKSREER